MTLESRRGRITPPNLDDRTWEDLVQEMRALIPTYAPQWTDQNPGDLGITLIELFAWLAEGMIYRLNRVPEKNYLAFLRLLDITRDPAVPAFTYLTFSTAPGAGATTVPAGSQAQTAGGEARTPVIFETDEAVTVLPTDLRTALLTGAYATGATSTNYDNLSTALVGPPAAKHLLTVPPGRSVLLCLGLDRSTHEEITLGVRLYLPRTGPADVEWVYSVGDVEPLDWPAVPAAQDGTGSLNHDGRVRLVLPADWARQQAAAEPPGAEAWTTVTPRDPGSAVTDPYFWLGLRVTNPAATSLNVGVDRLLFNAAPARTALTIRAPEKLGVSTGEPFQMFELPARPLYRRPVVDAPYGDLVVQVGSGEPTTWQTWTQATDLEPGPGTVYRVLPVTGEVLFGDHDPRTGRGRGSVPPAGSVVRALTYRHVATGAPGNVAAGEVTNLGTTVAGAGLTNVRVTNLGPGRDGADEEPIEKTLRRAPEEIKIRDRAVTADDFEFLAKEASPDIPVRKCLTPRLHAEDGPGTPPAWRAGEPWTFGGIVRARGTVNLVIVPDQGPTVPRPEPTRDQVRRVRAYLEERRDLTAQLQVLGPRYLPVAVRARLVVWKEAVQAGADRGAVRAEVLDRLSAFLHPTAGGPGGEGWGIGAPLLSSEVFRAIALPADLGYVASVEVKPEIPAYHFPPLNLTGTATNYDRAERPFPLSDFGASVRLADYELACAAPDASHDITVEEQAM